MEKAICWEEVLAKLTEKGIYDPVHFIKGFIPKKDYNDLFQKELNKTMINCLTKVEEKYQIILNADLKKVIDQKSYKMTTAANGDMILWNNKYTYGRVAICKDNSDNDEYYIVVKESNAKVYISRQNELVRVEFPTNDEKEIEKMEFNHLSSTTTINMKGFFYSTSEDVGNFCKIEDCHHKIYIVFVTDKKYTQEIINELEELKEFVSTIGWRL